MNRAYLGQAGNRGTEPPRGKCKQTGYNGLDCNALPETNKQVGGCGGEGHWSRRWDKQVNCLKGYRQIYRAISSTLCMSATFLFLGDCHVQDEGLTVANESVNLHASTHLYTQDIFNIDIIKSLMHV